jgi:hypothetical protein
MCELTKKMKRRAVKLEVVEDERIVEFSDKLRQRGMANIWLLRTNKSNSFGTNAHINKAESYGRLVSAAHKVAGARVSGYQAESYGEEELGDPRVHSWRRQASL